LTFLAFAIAFESRDQNLMKFKRDQNATEKFQIYINESENLWMWVKIVIKYHKISLIFMKIH